MFLATIPLSRQPVIFKTIQVIERNGMISDTIWTSETYIGNARFVKFL
jgi:hypothetical protein